MQGLDARGSCTLDPGVFGEVLDVRQPCECSIVVCSWRRRKSLEVPNTYVQRYVASCLVDHFLSSR